MVENQNSADQITVLMTNMNPSPEPEVGDVLEMEINSGIAGMEVQGGFDAGA